MIDIAERANLHNIVLQFGGRDLNKRSQQHGQGFF